MRLPLPQMFRGKYKVGAASPAAPIETLLENSLKPLRSLDLSGKSVAVAVGSRGIANISQIVIGVCDAVRGAGGDPFLIPAMGSHGGGTADGQAEVLGDLGLDPSVTGIPIRSSLQTMLLGTTTSDVPVYLDTNAMGADLIYVVGRVKPHTSFTGRLQSGLIKLLVVGAGKVDGARAFHRATLRAPHSDVLGDMFEVVMNKAPLLGGLAIVENATHETAILEHIPKSAVLDRELDLLLVATNLMPCLPVDDLDVLVIDEIGKNISGAGMDPNITGRRFAINSRWQEDSPKITRIVALRLTPESHGNTAGIGLADFVGPSLVAAMDSRPTYLNAITSMNTVHAQVPIHFPTDQETLYYAIRSVGLEDHEFERARVLRIRNTLDLSEIEFSRALLDELTARPDVDIDRTPRPWAISRTGSINVLGT